MPTATEEEPMSRVRNSVVAVVIVGALGIALATGGAAAAATTLNATLSGKARFRRRAMAAALHA